MENSELWKNVTLRNKMLALSLHSMISIIFVTRKVNWGFRKVSQTVIHIEQ